MERYAAHLTDGTNEVMDLSDMSDFVETGMRGGKRWL